VARLRQYLLTPRIRLLLDRLGLSIYVGATVTEQMKQKIDSGLACHIYNQRLGYVEPVFWYSNTAIASRCVASEARCK
jgi:hypothetical protein